MGDALCHENWYKINLYHRLYHLKKNRVNIIEYDSLTSSFDNSYFVKTIIGEPHGLQV